ncbi:thiol:disulfide interchange protein DsbD [Thermotomaculum hydrothermale]|uniref:Thiol:disulfide interchange protein DsbD n=1 Tax=Thermotomaculum hydrothermale TaxID=981385 RepID=A0A7R6SZT5_9BACT|nr:cytochrome c biogenesis protein CcdA [Thermotomaculum hydrothermale]BBB33062.1 thiol:disulfide interchange protein DsbD [Thermotomaculum hydrothermale]
MPAKTKTGEPVLFNLIIDVPHGYHITKEFLTVKFKNDTFKIDKMLTPEGKKTSLGEIVGGKVNVTINGKFVKTVKNPVIEVGYQACTEGENAMCFPPVTQEIKTGVKVEKGKLTLDQRVAGALDSSVMLALILIFIGGILASFTPCVYPVIPLTMAYVGAKSEGNKLKGFIISIALVLGIATTYSILGIISATTGSAFGSFTQSPIFIVFLGFIFIAMGLSMFGYYDIQLPYTWNTKLQPKKKGLIGAFLMGMATGILAAPCVGPIIVVLLTWVAKTGSLVKGFVYLFDFALGMGVLFVLIGTFSGVLASLPKAGGWMEKVKYIFGILFIVAALLFTKPILGKYFYLFAVLFFLPALIAMFYHKAVSKKTGLILLILITIPLIGVNFLTAKKESGITSNYATHISKAIEKAKSENKIVVIDFFTDWCSACEELEKYTWSNDDVENYLDKNAVFLKLNMTAKTKESQEILKKYNVIGYPTVIFINGDGKELKRFFGFVKPEKFLKTAEGLK